MKKTGTILLISIFLCSLISCSGLFSQLGQKQELSFSLDLSSLNTKASRQLGDVDEPYEDATVDATVVAMLFDKTFSAEFGMSLVSSFYYDCYETVLKIKETGSLPVEGAIEVRTVDVTNITDPLTISFSPLEVGSSYFVLVAVEIDGYLGAYGASYSVPVTMNNYDFQFNLPETYNVIGEGENQVTMYMNYTEPTVLFAVLTDDNRSTVDKSSVSVGETKTFTVQTSFAAGNLTDYQWYKIVKTSDSLITQLTDTVLSGGTLIEGATSDSYTLTTTDTSEISTTWYYCKVTVAQPYFGKEVSVYSIPVEVTVKESDSAGETFSSSILGVWIGSDSKGYVVKDGTITIVQDGTSETCTYELTSSVTFTYTTEDQSTFYYTYNSSSDKASIYGASIIAGTSSTATSVALTRSPVTVEWSAKDSDSYPSVDTTTAGMSFTATSTAPKVIVYLSGLTEGNSYTIHFICKTSGTSSAKDNVTYAIAENVDGEAFASGSTIDGLTETTFTTTIEDITFTAACLTLDFSLTEANETITISNFVVIPQ